MQAKEKIDKESGGDKSQIKTSYFRKKPSAPTKAAGKKTQKGK
jgi:hypothetical protein